MKNNNETTIGTTPMRDINENYTSTFEKIFVERPQIEDNTRMETLEHSHKSKIPEPSKRDILEIKRLVKWATQERIDREYKSHRSDKNYKITMTRDYELEKWTKENM